MSFPLTEITRAPRFLPVVLRLDGVSCLLTAAAQLGATPSLARATGLPESLLMATGAFMLVYGITVSMLSMARTIPRGLVGLIAIGNLGWALGAMMLLGWAHLPLSALGQAWVLAQAVTVVVLADLQWMGLRATRSMPTR